MANEIVDRLSYLVLASESTWGTTPGSPVWVHVPVTDYGVEFQPERRNATPFIGSFQRKHGKNFRGMISGPLTTSLFGANDSGASQSLAQYLLDWAFSNPEVIARPSKSAQWTEGPGVSDKDHKGLRVNSATLSGSEGTGVIELSLDLMGTTEALEASAESAPNDREKLQEFEFPDATFQLGGSTVQVSAFQWQRQYGLQVTYLNSTTPSLILKSQCVETLQMTLVKNADTYDAYRRSLAATELTGQIVAKGLHNGTGSTGNYTVVTIDFNRLSYANHSNQRGTPTMQPLQFDVLKPDSASNGVTITYSEAA